MGHRQKALSAIKHIKSSNQITFHFSIGYNFSIQLLVGNYNKYFKIYLIKAKAG